MFISVVNNGKRPQILRQTQKWANIRTREHTRTDARIHTSTLQYNLAVQSSISELEMHCAVLSGWTEHSWQQAVCLSADSSISSGWRTDRWRHCRVMSRGRKKRLKTASSLEKEPFSNWDEGLAVSNGNTWQDGHLFTLFRFSVKFSEINSQ